MMNTMNRLLIQKCGENFDWLTYYFKNPINQEFLQYTDYYNLMLKKYKKILIIEDDLVSFNLMQSFINDYDPDIKCFLAKNECDAIDILKTYECDLVISDYFLDSDETGLQICEKIKSQFPNVECSIVSSLKYYQYQEIINFSRIEPSFLEKPISKKQMMGFLDDFYREDQ